MLFSDTVGLAIFMPNCSFQVELEKDTIDETIADFDAQMDESLVDEDDDTRVLEVMQNAMMIGYALGKDEIDETIAVTEMAYSFLYAYVKQNGKVKEQTKGIIGVLTEEYVHFSTCLDASKFQKHVDETSSLHEETMSEELKDVTPPKPTIH